MKKLGQCPHCVDEPLVVFEFEGIETDQCVQCGGTWLDAGELELVFEREGLKRGPLAETILQRGGKRRKDRCCPRCARALKAFCIHEGIELDRCTLGHGLWLDAGEMKALIEHFAGTEGAKLATTRSEDFWARHLGQLNLHNLKTKGA